ncbi:MAG TPA: sugar ABC transporter permease [Gaiellaceae bacterium]|nr:sugar ABC transporter permease [Gaiellaceae bacterium]
MHVGRGLAPYALLAPASLAIAAVLAYPLYFLGKLSFQRYGLPELIAHKGTWVGADNFSRIVHDAEFWRVLVRTVVFTAGAVSLTMIFGTLIALLLARLGPVMRLLLTTGLVLVWAMPVVVAVNIWVWMFDFEFGVFNWALTELGVGDYVHHNWFENPTTGLAIIMGVVVWGAIPFVAITIYAGLTQVPKELVEAAAIDGAGPVRIFRDISLPLLKPIFVILASLSVIWDFQVFNQVWIMRGNDPSSDYYLMSVYAFVESFKLSEYGFGAAIALVMVAIMFCVTFVYIRQMVRIGEVR